MRHGVKKIKFKKGQDATTTTTKKLIVGFILSGRVLTTVKRAKVIKSEVERMAEKSKEKTEANRNYMLRRLGPHRVIKTMFEDVGPALKGKSGGYIKLNRVGYRDSDGAQMAKVSWVYPVVKTVEAEPVKKIAVKK